MRRLDRTRRLLFALGLVLVSAASPLAAQTPAWKTFGGPTEGFQVDFPSTPEISDTKVPVGADTFALRSYVVQSGFAALYIGVCDYGPKAGTADPDTIFSHAKQGAVEHISAHIVSEKKISLANGQGAAIPGLAFEAESDKLHFSVRMYLSGTVLYQVMATSPLNGAFADAERFLDSFKLITRPHAETTPTSSPHWESFSYPSDGFSALFPSEPVVAKQNVATGAGTLELRVYSAQDSSAEFIAAVCNYGTSAAGKDPDALLDAATSGAVSNIKGHLVSEKKITLGANHGVAFEAENSSAHLSARIYFAGTALYQLIVATPLGVTDPEAARFFDSFQLLPSQANY